MHTDDAIMTPPVVNGLVTSQELMTVECDRHTLNVRATVEQTF